jgi:hypothetical protein
VALIDANVLRDFVTDVRTGQNGRSPNFRRQASVVRYLSTMLPTPRPRLDLTASSVSRKLSMRLASLLLRCSERHSSSPVSVHAKWQVWRISNRYYPRSSSVPVWLSTNRACSTATSAVTTHIFRAEVVFTGRLCERLARLAEFPVHMGQRKGLSP